MALKDWKKVKNEKTLITYYKYDRNNPNNTITDELLVGEMNEYNKQWGVVIFRNNKKVPILEDKTKSQALSFAKKYMRTH